MLRKHLKKTDTWTYPLQLPIQCAYEAISRNCIRCLIKNRYHENMCKNKDILELSGRQISDITVKITNTQTALDIHNTCTYHGQWTFGSCMFCCEAEISSNQLRSFILHQQSYIF